MSWRLTWCFSSRFRLVAPVRSEIRLPMYATAGIPVVWIVDANAETIAVHRQPEGARYVLRTITDAGGSVALPWGRDLSVEQILHGPA